MLDSSLAQSIVWGPRRLLLYNDAYVPFLGSKHPVAFGKELDQVWPEIWTDIGPLVDSARSGESHQLEDMPLTLTRHGKNDRSWFTFYYSPVRDESGVIQGMCSSVVETTRRVLAENRQAAMLEFSDALSTAREAAPLIEMAVKACRDYLEECSIEVCDAVAAGLAVQDYRNLEQGLVVRTHLPDKPAGCDARMLLPVVQAGRLAAVLDIRNAQVASWTEMDVSFAQEICSRARLAGQVGCGCRFDRGEGKRAAPSVPCRRTAADHLDHGRGGSKPVFQPPVVAIHRRYFQPFDSR